MNTALTRPLITIYFARLISLIGDRMYLIALTIYLAGQNGEYLAILWMSQLALPIVTGFFEGTVIDRLGYRRTAVAGDIVNAAATALMPFVLHEYVWLFVLAFIVSGAASFSGTAMNPMISDLTTEETRHQANSLNGTMASIALFVGPVLGGSLFVYNHQLPFWLQSGSFAVSALCLLSIRLPVRQADALEQDGEVSVWRDLRMSLRFIWRNHVLRTCVALFVLFNLGTGILEPYQVLFLTQAVHLSAQTFTVVVSVSGLALVAGGLVNARYLKRVRPEVLAPIGTLVTLLGLIPYTFSTSFAGATASLVVSSLGTVTILASVGTIRMNAIPSSHQGRILGVVGAMSITAATVAILVGAVLIPHVEIRVIFMMAVAIMIPTFPIALRLLAPAPSGSVESPDADISS